MFPNPRNKLPAKRESSKLGAQSGSLIAIFSKSSREIGENPKADQFADSSRKVTRFPSFCGLPLERERAATIRNRSACGRRTRNAKAIGCRPFRNKTNVGDPTAESEIRAVGIISGFSSALLRCVFRRNPARCLSRDAPFLNGRGRRRPGKPKRRAGGIWVAAK